MELEHIAGNGHYWISSLHFWILPIGIVIIALLVYLIISHRKRKSSSLNDNQINNN
jgi:hypothetical protein